MKLHGMFTALAVLAIGMFSVSSLAQSDNNRPGMMNGNDQGGMMSMEACHAECAATSATLKALTAVVDEARSSGDVATLSAALDRVHTDLTTLEEKMQTCRESMKGGMSMQGRDAPKASSPPLEQHQH